MEVNDPVEEKVMIVDDDSSICNLLAEVLGREGYSPIICNHPHHALALLEQESLPLAFVDLNMPDMSGLELAPKLKELDPQVEVVFMTGHGNFDSAIQAIKIGAYDYLRKPFTTNDFILCLKRFQERSALKKQVKLAEERYFDLVQNTPLLIYILRRDFKIDFVNQACSALLGYTP